MIWGYLCLALCVILLIKYVTRKCKLTKLDKLLRKLHIPCGIAAIMIVGLHLFVTFKVWPGRSLILVGSGIIAMLLIFTMTFFYMQRKKLSKKWLPYHRVGAVICLVMIVLHISLYFVDLTDYRQRMADTMLSGVDLTQIEDGSYIGSYSVGFIYAKVQVEVAEGRIKDIILLEHYNERGKKAEVITADIVREQNTSVDCITGATNSSTVIKKAIENALSK